MLAGAAVTAGEFIANMVIGGSLMSLGEELGEKLGSAMMGPPTGTIISGSPNVVINGRPAARVLDPVACAMHGDPDAIAQGSTGVFINGLPASRVGDKIVCGGVIIGGSSNVMIGGGAVTKAPIKSEISPWARRAALLLSIAPGGFGLGRALMPALRGIAEDGFLATAKAGARSIGGAMEERAGSGGIKGEPATGEISSAETVFTPKKLGQTEPGAVPASPELAEEMRAASQHTGLSAEGYPELPASEAKNFGEGARPWNGDDESGTIYRVVGADSNPNGAYWQRSLPENEAEWRSGSAVLNDWNGDGSYVQSSSAGLRGWIGPAAPQMSSDGTSMLAGQGEQIWLPSGSASPSAPMRTPWNPGG